MLDKIQAYAKFLVAIIGAVLTSASTLFPDNTVVKDWGPLVLSLVTAIAVYRVPNRVQPPNA